MNSASLILSTFQMFDGVHSDSQNSEFVQFLHGIDGK